MEKLSVTQRHLIIEGVLATHSNLRIDGFKAPTSEVICQNQIPRIDKHLLLSDWWIDQVVIAYMFLDEVITKYSEGNWKMDCSTLTHDVEVWSMGRGKPQGINTGAAIAAAIICGLEVEQKDNSECATIYFTTHSQDAEKKGSTSI